jgi:mannose-6-phosphate isomerase-like protein (cupin superfamily)
MSVSVWSIGPRRRPVEHDQVTEVYRILAGSGTMVTGGTLVKPQRRGSNDAALRDLTGPSTSGASIQEGESRHVGPGDIVIIPAGVGHWFSKVDRSIDYIVVRIDPDRSCTSSNNLVQRRSFTPPARPASWEPVAAVLSSPRLPGKVPQRQSGENPATGVHRVRHPYPT